MRLNHDQIEAIKNGLRPIHDESGTFDIDIELGSLTVNATGEVDIEGYVEDDYLNGTGAFIETRRNATVALTGFDEAGDEVFIDSDAERAVCEYLNAA